MGDRDCDAYGNHIMIIAMMMISIMLWMTWHPGGGVDQGRGAVGGGHGEDPDRSNAMPCRNQRGLKCHSWCLIQPVVRQGGSLTRMG